MDLDQIGLSTVRNSTAFKKIQYFSKINTAPIFNTVSDYETTYSKLGGLYKLDSNLVDSLDYGISRQQEELSILSSCGSFSTFLDNTSFNKLFNYNNTLYDFISSNPLDISRYKYVSGITDGGKYLVENQIVKALDNSYSKKDFSIFKDFIVQPNAFSVLSNESDSKQFSNNFKYSLGLKAKRKLQWNFKWCGDTSLISDISIGSPYNFFSSHLFNSENLLKFKDLKSSNMQFLGSEKTARFISNINASNFK
jgi:hypothetical protein